MKEYKCSAGIIMILPLIFLIGFGLFEFPKNQLYGFGSIVFALLIFYGRPTSISVDDNGIMVNQKLFPRTINFTEIKSVRRADLMDYFFTAKIQMNRLCTQFDSIVMIKLLTNYGSCVFISPDDREAFLADIAQRYPGMVTGNEG